MTVLFQFQGSQKTLLDLVISRDFNQIFPGNSRDPHLILISFHLLIKKTSIRKNLLINFYLNQVH